MPIFSIGVIAAMTGTGVNSLRRAEKLGLIPRADRTLGGQRRWRAEDIPVIRRAMLRRREDATVTLDNVS